MTGVEVPSEKGAGMHDGDTAGIWHQEWDQWQQGQWLEQFYRIALSKPFVDTVTYSNLIDTKNSIIPHSGLLTEKSEPRKSFQVLKRLHDTIFNR